jgi:hypothetical protein
MWLQANHQATVWPVKQPATTHSPSCSDAKMACTEVAQVRRSEAWLDESLIYASGDLSHRPLAICLLHWCSIASGTGMLAIFRCQLRHGVQLLNASYTSSTGGAA